MSSEQPLSKIPETLPGGFIPTLNRMGFMTDTLDEYSLYWVQEASQAKLPVLEVGTAYGIATTQALQAGACVIANDLDPRHLQLLKESVPYALQPNLTLIVGRFPDEVTLASNSISAVLISRVLHFLDGDTIERAVAKLFDWLAPGGKAIVTAETPFLGNLADFRPIYEANRQAGERWPGWIPDVSILQTHRKEALPPQWNMLDTEVLTRTFENAGFTIERCDFFARPDYPEDLQGDGRESVGCIAVKP